jgi:hypothetical protein
LFARRRRAFGHFVASLPHQAVLRITNFSAAKFGAANFSAPKFGDVTLVPGQSGCERYQITPKSVRQTSGLAH